MRSDRRERFERIAVGRPGEEVLRRRVRSHTQLRFTPGLPNIVQFTKQMVTETPLVIMLFVVAVLTAIVAVVLFFTERNVNDNVDSYLDTVWWAVFTMQTHGNSWRPESSIGIGIGMAWAVIGTTLFYGAIIASITVYFMRRRERSEREILTVIKRNFDDLDHLNLQELEFLKESTDNVINLQIEHVKAKSQPAR